VIDSGIHDQLVVVVVVTAEMMLFKLFKRCMIILKHMYFQNYKKI